MYGDPTEFYDEDDPQESSFVTKDSGEKAVHSDGVQRDTERGKVKYTLMFPEGVPMREQLIVRVAELYTRGGEKYGDRNWEASCKPDTLKHHKDALWRHFMSFFFEEDTAEDHAAAVIWNINAVELTRRNIRRSEPEPGFPCTHGYGTCPVPPARRVGKPCAGPCGLWRENNPDPHYRLGKIGEIAASSLKNPPHDNSDPWTEYQNAWDAIENPSDEAVKWAKLIIAAEERRNPVPEEPDDRDSDEETAEYGTPEAEEMWQKFNQAFDGATDSRKRTHTQLVYLDDSRSRHIAVDYEEGADIGFVADRAALITGQLPDRKFTIALEMGNGQSRVLPRKDKAVTYAGMFRWHLRNITFPG